MQLNEAKRNYSPTTAAASGSAMPPAGHYAALPASCPPANRQTAADPKTSASSLPQSVALVSKQQATPKNALAPAIAVPGALQLSDLPRDVLPTILQHLSSEDLQDARLACKTLAQASNDRRLPGWHEMLQTGIFRAGSPQKVLSVLREAAANGTLEHGESLDLTDLKLTGEHLEQICAVFAGLESNKLKWLDLSENKITMAGAKALAQTACLAGLQHLDLGGNDLHDAGAGELAKGTFTALRHLNLRLNSIGAEGVRALTKAASLPALEHLDLSRNDLGPQGAEALGQARHWPLAHLDLGSSGLTDDGVKTLMRGGHFKFLKHLDLSFNGMEGPSAEALAHNRQLRGLQHLSLKCNPGLGDEGIEQVTKQQFTNLNHLDLHCTGLTRRGARALATSGHLGTLLHLDVGLNGLDDLAGATLAQASQFSQLRYLNMSSGSVGPQTVDALVKLGHFAGLEHLDLSWHSISDRDAQALLQAPHFAAMRFLDLRMNRLSFAGSKALDLAGRATGCRVRT